MIRVQSLRGMRIAKAQILVRLQSIKTFLTLQKVDVPVILQPMLPRLLIILKLIVKVVTIFGKTLIVIDTPIDITSSKSLDKKTVSFVIATIDAVICLLYVLMLVL